MATREGSRPVSAELRLRELGIKLPALPQPIGAYAEAVQTGYRHTTACDQASECVFFFEGDGKSDLKVVEEKKAQAKM